MMLTWTTVSTLMFRCNIHPNCNCLFVSYTSVARFLESRGMIEDALEVATDPDYRFDLAIQLGRLEVAKVSAQVHIFLQGYII